MSDTNLDHALRLYQDACAVTILECPAEVDLALGALRDLIVEHRDLKTQVARRDDQILDRLEAIAGAASLISVVSGGRSWGPQCDDCQALED